MKHLFLLPILALLFACNQPVPKATIKEVKLEGKTMGTTYHVTYLDSAGRDFQISIDSVLVVVNNSMSTYIPTSLISQFNQMDSVGEMSVDDHFAQVYELSSNVYKVSSGSFNPSVMPLVNLFGFGFEKLGEVDSSKVELLRKSVQFDSTRLIYVINPENFEEFAIIQKKLVNVQLDFSAVAKGYGVDVVGLVLESKGIQSYMVEIGGEVRARGKNKDGELWRIGIDKPEIGARPGVDLKAIIQLDNESMATSGNYRNFKEKDGKKYVHTINPKTGWPEINNTLSVSVIAPNCAMADAYATAFMVMGVDKAYEIALNDTLLEAYFIYSGDSGQLLTKATPGLNNKLTKIEQ
ncbi:FAD:protein FMN transferase [soil metagenome]